LNNGLVDFSGKGININIVIAGLAESTGNAVSAARAPYIKDPAIFAKADIAAVAKNHTFFFLANLAKTCIVGNYHVAPRIFYGWMIFKVNYG
jgi:hypothetical protein